MVQEVILLNCNEISSLIVEENSDMIFISDQETYELYYLNQAALNMLDLEEEREWKGKKCYEVLQALTSPCAFCNNSCVNEQYFHTWEHYNIKMDRHFHNKAKVICYEGKRLRLKISADITEKRKTIDSLRQKAQEEETLVACIQILNRRADSGSAVGDLLKLIGRYHKAERAYIFEINEKKGVMTNAFEWCEDGVAFQMESLQEVPLSIIERWFKNFDQQGMVWIPSLENEVKKDSEEYQVLHSQKVEALMAVPLLENGRIIGFLGVDNPQENQGTPVLMQSVAACIVNDINKKKMLEKLKHLSYTDPLTGIGNRNKYTQELINLERNPPKTFGVVFADINGLKGANDTYGHKFGDQLINYAAKAMKSVFREGIFRIGGDEFVILCPDMERTQFEEKVSRLRKLSDEEGELQMSVGSTWGEGVVDIGKQVAHTDELMYIEKQSYYERWMEGRPGRQGTLSRELLKQIQEGRFQVYLQPKVMLETGILSGAEALVRRIDEEGNLEGPGKFLPKFEAEGIIRHVDFFVFRKVCQIMNIWRKEGRKMLEISVNLSRITLMEHHIIEELLDICSHYEIKPEQINIEVTESVGTMEKGELQELIMGLKKAGFSVSLDDFGSQYSNLAILTEMDFTEVKLDKSLIANLEENQKSRVVAEHTIQLCNDLELKNSVAEGIETEGQRKLLKDFDCRMGQGFFFDQPMPIEEFTNKYLKGCEL